MDMFGFQIKRVILGYYIISFDVAWELHSVLINTRTLTWFKLSNNIYIILNDSGIN